jgi:hypothetical protein
MQCVRRLSGVGGMDYAALEPGCCSLYIASGKPFQFDSDSENAVHKNVPEDSKMKGIVVLCCISASCYTITSLLYLMSHRLIMQQLFMKFSSSVYSPLHVSASL